MKAILMSIRPEYVADILNGKKNIEIRKTAPKCELLIDVYIYCTKNKLHYSVGALMFNRDDCFKHSVDGTYKYGDSVELMGYSPDYQYDKNNFLNGKVVAKFTLNKVENIGIDANGFCYETSNGDVLKDSCLSFEEMARYLNYWMGSIDFNLDVSYAWHISDLVIFDKPKELSEFKKLGYEHEVFALECHLLDIEGCNDGINESYVDKCYEELEKEYQITRAPQSWCYAEVEE